ncbi:hypothetical protein ACFVDV_07375 [Streptomyces albidoflavus]
MYITTAGEMLADDPGRAWSETEASLFMLLFDFNQVWIPVLLMATMALTIGRRRPGRLLAAGFLGRVTSMRNRVEALSLALEDAAGWQEQDKRALALRMTERRR